MRVLELAFRGFAASRRLRVLFAALALAGSGCASVYMGQAAVPNTQQRLVVGHDGWPFQRVWVIENGIVHDVRIVMESTR